VKVSFLDLNVQAHSAEIARPDYRADIDGLRAVAVALVVGFHAFPTVVRGGFIGVDVFLVISGYLITGIIRSGLRSSEFRFSIFYARRARRILPALAIVLAGVLAIGWLLLLPATYQSLGLHAFAGALFFPNLLSWSEVGYFDASAEAKPLLHLWSLGVEEQFYLLWPLLLAILSRKQIWLNIGLSVIIAGSLFYSYYATAHQPAAAFYSPLSRLWELGVGGFLATANLRLQNRDSLSLLGLVLIVGCAFVLTKTSPFPGWRALLPVGGAALVIVFGSNLLSRNWPARMGLISYPLYLWHWPLLSFAAMAGVASVAAKLAIVVVSVFLAELTTRFIELPIRFGHLRRSGVSISLAAMVLIIGCSSVIWRGGGIPSRYPREIQPVLATMQYDPASDARVPQCWLNNASAFEDYSHECAVGATLIWGDSHAARLYAGLKKDGVDVAQFTRDSCPPPIGGGYEICAQSNDAILKKIAELKPKKVILFAAWGTYNEDGPRDIRFTQTLIRLKEIVDDVVVLGPAPFWSPDLPTQVYNFWRLSGLLPDRLQPRPIYYRRMDDALSGAANAANVRFISVFNALCNQDGCLTHTPESKGDLLTWDDGHLTLAGARFLATLVHLH
jgi:peptidoglycan/LPS O-acetylase OafA/YrhL